MLSAQVATRSQWCGARYCPFDSEPSGLCRQHENLRDAGIPIVMHTIEQPVTPDPDTHLWCNVCQTWKPDAAFARCSQMTWRRQRHQECSACNAARRKARREGPGGAAIRAHEAAISRAGKARRRARKAAEATA